MANQAGKEATSVPSSGSRSRCIQMSGGPYKYRDQFGAPPPLPPTFINTLWFYRLQSSSKNISVLIDVMSDMTDIELQFEQLLCMHS